MQADIASRMPAALTAICRVFHGIPCGSSPTLACQTGKPAELAAIATRSAAFVVRDSRGARRRLFSEPSRLLIGAPRLRPKERRDAAPR